MESKKWTGCSIGTIGGGVNFLSGTLYIYLTNARKIIENLSGDALNTIKDYFSNPKNEIPDEIREQALKLLSPEDNQ